MALGSGIAQVEVNFRELCKTPRMGVGTGTMWRVEIRSNIPS